MTNSPAIRCPYCEQRHKPRFLCDPAASLLQALLAKAEKKGIPVGQLDDAHGPSGDIIMQSITIDGATIPIAGGIYPGVVFTGTDLTGRQLPNWAYASSAEQLAKLPQIIAARVQAAIAALPAPEPAEPAAVD